MSERRDQIIHLAQLDEERQTHLAQKKLMGSFSAEFAFCIFLAMVAGFGAGSGTENIVVGAIVFAGSLVALTVYAGAMTLAGQLRWIFCELRVLKRAAIIEAAPRD